MSGRERLQFAMPDPPTGPTVVGQRQSLRERQDPHSLYLVFAGALLLLTLVVDVVLHRDELDLLVIVGLIGACLLLGTSALVFGRRFPRWLGMFSMFLLVVASIYFLSSLGNTQSAVTSLQELPILALYLGWFVRRPFARILFYASLSLLLAVIALNPVFFVGGTLGVAAAVQAIVVAIFCFEVGSALWRRTELKVTSDALTRALTRVGFMTRLDSQLAKSVRTGSPLSLVVIDFDNFKQLNDAEGHAAGDQALVDTVKQWRGLLRSRDAIGRTGGDEFAILLAHTDEQSARVVTTRLSLASTHSWSWGIAQAQPGDTVESLFVRADERLYEAKRSRA